MSDIDELQRQEREEKSRAAVNQSVLIKIDNREITSVEKKKKKKMKSMTDSLTLALSGELLSMIQQKNLPTLHANAGKQHDRFEGQYKRSLAM